MAAAPRPQVTQLDQGEVFETKRMEAAEGVQWPRHKASHESVLVVTEGTLKVAYSDAQSVVRTGESIVIAADTWHEIVPDPTFRAIHIMPKGIRFTFAAEVV